MMLPGFLTRRNVGGGERLAEMEFLSRRRPWPRPLVLRGQLVLSGSKSSIRRVTKGSAEEDPVAGERVLGGQLACPFAVGLLSGHSACVLLWEGRMPCCVLCLNGMTLWTRLGVLPDVTSCLAAPVLCEGSECDRDSIPCPKGHSNWRHGGRGRCCCLEFAGKKAA